TESVRTVAVLSTASLTVSTVSATASVVSLTLLVTRSSMASSFSEGRAGVLHLALDYLGFVFHSRFSFKASADCSGRRLEARNWFQPATANEPPRRVSTPPTIR